MDPFTLMAMGSTALTALGKLGQGFTNSGIDQIQQQVANANTQLLVQRANLEKEAGQLSLDQGAVESARTVATLNRTIGAETAKFASSNLDPTSGSPLLLEAYSAGQGATDLALIGARSQLGMAQAIGQSAGTMAQAAGSAGQAAAFGLKQTSDIMGGLFGAGSALLSGFSNKAQWGALNGIANGGGFGGGAGIEMGF